MKVSAFAKWLDLQNRTSLKEVQAVLGSRESGALLLSEHPHLFRLAAKNKNADASVLRVLVSAYPQYKYLESIRSDPPLLTAIEEERREDLIEVS